MRLQAPTPGTQSMLTTNIWGWYVATRGSSLDSSLGIYMLIPSGLYTTMVCIKFFILVVFIVEDVCEFTEKTVKIFDCLPFL